MNSMEFAKQVQSDKMSFVVTKFFNEIMLLYNLIGDAYKMDIYADDTSSTAVFALLMDEKSDAENLYNRFNGTVFTVYEVKYKLEMMMLESQITCTIRAIQ